jgi:ubiquinone/menaquinone biosynthesis C-methylase UbiE
MDEYSKIAPYYEKILGKPLSPIRNKIRTYIKSQGHRRVVDICCGTGRQLEMLIGEDMDLVGVDTSQAMLNQSRQKDGIRLMQNNAIDIDLPEKSFDAAILTFSLHEKDEVEREILLEKSWKLVRTGGHLLIGDYCRIPPTLKGFLWGKIIIPMVERAAGKNHYLNYSTWMRNGALEQHLEKITTEKIPIAMHFNGTVALYAIERR